MTTNGNMTWPHRLKLIWLILSTGHQFKDQLVFSKSQVLKIISYLNNAVAGAEESK